MANNLFNLPVPGSARFERDVAMALARLRATLGPEGRPTFDGVELDSLTISAFSSSGFVKNDTAGLLSGGNSIGVGDLPAHALTHESGGDDEVDHDSLAGFVADEHVAHSDVSISAGTGLSGGGDITTTRTLSLDATLKSHYDDAYTHSLVTSGNPHSVTPTELSLVIGTDVQAWDAQLDDIAALAVTDGNIIVGDGANWVAESGATARTSLGLGTGDSPAFAGLSLTDTLVLDNAVGINAKDSGGTTRNLLLRYSDDTVYFDNIISGKTIIVRVDSGANTTTFANTQTTFKNQTVSITNSTGTSGFNLAQNYFRYFSSAINQNFYLDNTSIGGKHVLRVSAATPNDTIICQMDPSGPLTTFAGTVRADTRFNLNGTDGGSGTVNFNDGDAQAHVVTIAGGIITSWAIATAEQLS